VSKRPSNWYSIAQQTYKRDDFTCQNCGRRGGHRGNTELHAHHGVPLKNGGTNDLSNLTTYCKECHLAIHTDQDAPTAQQNPNDTDPPEAAFPSPILDCPNCGNIAIYDTSITMYKLDSTVRNLSPTPQGLAVECVKCGMILEGRPSSQWEMVEGSPELIGLTTDRGHWRKLSEKIKRGVSPLQARKEVEQNIVKERRKKFILTLIILMLVLSVLLLVL